MFKFLGIIVLAILAAILILAAMRPDTFRVERTTRVGAPPDKVFALINDFTRWGAWSPWEKKDPAMKRTFGTVTSGNGATYAWEGNKDVGRGSMTIVESIPPSRVRMNLDFVKPFEAHNVVKFALEPIDGGTQVTWTMEGGVPYFAKVVHLFFDMDRMVGGEFEAGLAAMKTAAEK